MKPLCLYVFCFDFNFIHLIYTIQLYNFECISGIYICSDIFYSVVRNVNVDVL